MVSLRTALSIGASRAFSPGTICHKNSLLSTIGFFPALSTAVIRLTVHKCSANDASLAMAQIRSRPSGHLSGDDAVIHNEYYYQLSPSFPYTLSFFIIPVPLLRYLSVDLDYRRKVGEKSQHIGAIWSDTFAEQPCMFPFSLVAMATKIQSSLPTVTTTLHKERAYITD